MAFDGIFLHFVLDEINSVSGCRIEKIHQPSKNELVLLLRKSGMHKKLLICARPGAARCNFTDNSYENPPAPPMFCMLMRKHLCGAKFFLAEQLGCDRVVHFLFEGTNEMGDITTFNLVCEFTGAKANIILVNGEGRIIDALRRSDPETDERMILPGAKYEPIVNSNKLNPFKSDRDLLVTSAKNEGSILKSIAGVSPLIDRELGEAADAQAVDRLLSAIDNNKPTVTLDPDNNTVEFSYCPITQYGPDYKHKEYPSYNSLLDDYYSQKDKQNILGQYKNDIQKTVSKLISRTVRKAELRKAEQISGRDREHLRIWGELLKANLYAIDPSLTSVTVKNYYSESLQDITIPLDPSLSPAANASKYFKEYKKQCVAAGMLEDLIAEANRDLEYLKSVAHCIDKAESKRELDAIYDELQDSGYIKTRTKRQKAAGTGAPLEYSFAEYHILCGKNNRQNDRLTFKTAGKNDLWLHARNIPGAHVILFCNNREPIPQAIEFAATVAAKHSFGANSGGVSVDYTKVRYVKKPPGAKPGMVTYDKFSTVYIKLDGREEKL